MRTHHAAIARLLVIGVLWCLLLACGGQSAPGAPTTPDTGTTSDIEGELWRLQQYASDTGDLTAVLPATDNNATLRLEDGNLMGNAGCNSFFGSYTVQGNTLNAEPGGSTEMACFPIELMDQEQRYISLLAEVATYQATDERLELANSAGDTILVFAADQPVPLVGTTWQLESYNNGEGGIVSLLAGTTITAEFTAESDTTGRLSGSAGCNTYQAAYTLDADNHTLSIQDGLTTAMECSQPAGIMEQESASMNSILQTARYRLEGTTLKLLAADDTLLASFVASQDASGP